MSKKMFTVLVEGNIGSGKTTLIEHFSKRYPESVFPLLEPVDKWRDARGCNLLALMYSDPKRWSLAFQQYVQLTMIQLHQQNPPAVKEEVDTDGSIKTPLSLPTVKLMERSLYSARHCFVENLVRIGLMSSEEEIVYDEWFKWLTSQAAGGLEVDLIIYLRTSPETCHERINRRSRPEERKVSLSYLEQLHKLHEEWLLHESDADKRPCPVITIPADGNLDQMLEHLEKELPSSLKERFEAETQARPSAAVER